jgi:hypothetical protein
MYPEGESLTKERVDQGGASPIEAEFSHLGIPEDTREVEKTSNKS